AQARDPDRRAGGSGRHGDGPARDEGRQRPALHLSRAEPVYSPSTLAAPSGADRIDAVTAAAARTSSPSSSSSSVMTSGTRCRSTLWYGPHVTATTPFRMA